MANLLVYDRLSPVPRDWKQSSVLPIVQELRPSSISGIEITSALAYPENVDGEPHVILMQAMNISVLHHPPFHGSVMRYKCVFPHIFNGRLYAVQRPQIERTRFGRGASLEQLTPAMPRITENIPLILSRHLLYGTYIDPFTIERSLDSMESRIMRYTDRVRLDGVYED